MKIVVCAKFVPDATADRRFRAEDNTVDRAGVDGLLSELDENAVEAALAIKDSGGDADGVAVTVLTVGPEQAADAVKKALQMGADAGVHVVDDAIHGSDALATSLVIAKALEKLEHDLVVFGMASTDGTMGVVAAMVAERLGLPAVTLGSEVTVDGQTVRIRRDGDTASDTIEGTLPLVLSVSDQANEPRYPSFKGIMAAKKKPVQTWSLADLGVAPEQVGASAAWSEVTEVTARPPRTAGTIVTDDGTGATQLVEFLSTNKFL
ncbi:electron transfer flavoprotein subunit beta/FixA family protein [Kribbella deserti]|uniref:Electron transfer flavoprotein subunit beta n=1 Tax=Kribbella deserti TaxID=1926257 RepID=A0ABV6QWK1_9ACTN